MVQKDEVSELFCLILLLEVRSREIFPVSVLRNCRMGMSSPRVDRGQKIQEYSRELSSS